MTCLDRQLTSAQLEAGFDQSRNAGALKAIRPFTGEATPENLVDYLNREVFPVLKQARAAVNEIFRQVTDNAPSGNPLTHIFSLALAGDPTAGFIALNNATQENATVVRVSQNNNLLRDITPWLDVMAGSSTTPLGVVTLFKGNDPSRFLRFDLNTMTDQGAYWDLAVTAVESSHDNPFVADDQAVLAFIPGVASSGATVPAGSIGPIADETFLGNVSGAPAPATAILLSSLAGTGITWDAAGNNFDVTAPFVPQGWDDVLSVDNNSGAFNPHVDDGQFLSFGVEGSIPASGDIRSSDAFTINVTGAAALLGSTTASITGGGSNGFAASAAAVILGAGTAGITVINNGLIRLTAGATERLEIEATGAWQLGGLVGTAGQYMRSSGAGASPAWATITVSEIPTIVATTGAVTIPAGGGASLFAGILDNGAAENDRQNLNFLSTTSVIAVVTDDAGNNELELTWQRAALTGAIASAQNSNATVFAGIRDDNVATTDRGNLNFVSTVSNSAVLVDDAANDEIEIQIERAALTGAITASNNSNATLFDTNASGSGLTGGGTAVLNVGAGTGITVNANDVQLSTLAAETFFGNFTAAVAVGTGVAGSTVAGAGLTYTTGGILAVGAGTNVTVNANDIAVTNFPLTGLAAAAANTVIANATAGSAAPTAVAVAADNVLARVGGNLVSHPWATLAGTRLTYAAGVMDVDLAAAYAWTGVHGFTGSSFTVDSTGAVVIEGSASSALRTDTGTLFIENTGAGTVEINGAAGATSLVLGSATAILSSGTQIRINTNGVERLEIEPDGAWQLAGDTGTAGEVLTSAGSAAPPTWGPYLRLREIATGTAASASGTVVLWARNTADSRLKITDEGGTDYPVGFAAVAANATTSTATNSISQLTITSHSIPANTLLQRDTYRLSGCVLFNHTAAATPIVSFTLRIGATVVESADITPVASAAAFSFRVEAIVQIHVTGAGGSCQCSIAVMNNVGNGTLEFNAINDLGSAAANAINTTVSNTLDLRVQMTSAVASNTLTVLHGYTERLGGAL